MSDMIDLKKRFEEKAAEALAALNALETLNAAEGFSTLGGPSLAIGRALSESREALQKAQATFSTNMADKIRAPRP